MAEETQETRSEADPGPALGRAEIVALEPSQAFAAPATPGLPPILAGHATGEQRERVGRFYASVDSIFEAWVTRRQSPHTQRAYRGDVMDFVAFLGIPWPTESFRLLTASVADVHAWRDRMLGAGMAPKTINRRVSSLSSFFKYLAGTAAELRLPITVPNPAHAQFVARQSSDPVRERRALSATRARQLMGLPSGESVLEYRDRAILKLFVYTGVRIGTLSRLDVADFHEDGGEATLRINEKGDKHRTIGIHFAAAQAVREYLERAALTDGPLFRARLNPRSAKLGRERISPRTLHRLVVGHLRALIGATEDGAPCPYTPHSLRATVATLLLDAAVDIAKVQELLGHRHITTTQIYDKRRRTTRQSASHDVPI